MRRAIILANGEFPQRGESLQQLRQAETLICCDGAYLRLVASAVFEDGQTVRPLIYVIGDGDSLPLSVRSNSPLAAQFVEGYTDQDTNDLTKAVRFALSQGVTHIDIYGGTGLREDHTLGNISLLADYSLLKSVDGTLLTVAMVTDYGVFRPLNGSAIVSSFKGQQVSLFSLNPDLVISTQGLKYPLHERRLHSWWEATLNEAEGDTVTLTLSGPGTLLLFQTHEAKKIEK